MSDIDEIIASAEKLCEANPITACEIIIDYFDDLMLSDKFEEIDAYFPRADTEKLNAQQMIAILSATLPGQPKLKNREDFYERCWSTLESRGRNVKALLNYLKYYVPFWENIPRN